MFKLDPVIDPKEADVIKRRQRNEEQRKQRVFDPRQRLIGVDVEGLQNQVDEKQLRKLTDENRERAFDQERIRYDNIAVLLDKRLERDNQEFKDGINKFRRECQKPETRKEFDLYDPNALKKELPARVSDDDPRCTVSSIQKFEGEDINGQIRAMVQKRQLEKWLTQQMCERKEAERLQNAADNLYITKLTELDHRAVELQEAQHACRQAIMIAAQNYNNALAKQKEMQKVFEKQQEIEDNFTEISNAIFGDILNEKPDDGRGAFGAKRIEVTSWKGFTPEQLADIRRVQMEQVIEKEFLRDKEKSERLQWDGYMNSATNAAIMRDMQEKREIYEKNKNLKKENLDLAAQQNEMKAYLNKEVYVGRMSEDFFQQFNKSSR